MLIAFLPHDTATTALHSSIDARLMLFTFVVSVAAGMLSGFAPALHAGRKSLVSSLRERGSTGGGVRLRKVIVSAQIALSLVLVSGAVLFARTLTGLLAGARVRHIKPRLIRSRSSSQWVLPIGSEPAHSPYSGGHPRFCEHPDVGGRAFPVVDRWQLEQSHDDSNRSTNRHRSGRQLECDNPGILCHTGNQSRRRAETSTSATPGPRVSRCTRGDCQRSVRQAIPRGPQSARRADLSGCRTRRAADHRNRGGGRGLQLSRSSRAVGAGVLPTGRRPRRRLAIST